MKNRLTVIAVAVAVAACGGIPTPEPASVPLRIEPVITRATEVNFESGDAIGLTVIREDGSVYADNALLTYDGSSFAGDLKWYSGDNGTCSLKAFYPYSAADFPTSFTVGTDQRGGTGAYDLMLAAKQDVKPQEEPVTMVFRHQLSRIVMSLENEAGIEIESITLKGLHTTVHFAEDTEDGGPIAYVDESDPKGDIVMEAVKPGLSYRAIVVPQTMAFGVAVRTRGGASLVQDFTEVTMKPGYSYTITGKVSAEGIAFRLSGEISAWDDGGDIEPDGDPSGDDFKDNGDSFSYHGKDYATVVLPDGSRWMAEPLAYLPAGRTVSDDPAAGDVWYPYSSDGANVTVLKDEESIKSLGYLYSFDALLGTSVTGDNFDKLEGAQGICPPGWHIPSRADWFALCGYSNRSAYLGESGSMEDHSAVFWDETDGYASVPGFNAGGFNFTLSGAMVNNKFQALLVDESVCSVPELYGRNRMTYIASSTPNSATQYFVVMTTFTKSYPKGRVTLAYAPLGKAGVQVRCVKDK